MQPPSPASKNAAPILRVTSKVSRQGSKRSGEGRTKGLLAVKAFSAFHAERNCGRNCPRTQTRLRPSMPSPANRARPLAYVSPWL